MGGEWREIPLGKFVRLQRGHDLTASERRPGNVPVMGSAGQNGWHDTARAPGPGVVIGRSDVGSMGAVHYCARDFWPHNTTLYVTDFCGNDPLFAYFLLATLNFRRYDSGSAQASLNRNYLYNIPVLRPPLPQQRAIARVLGTLDDKIELNRRTNETLEAVARALFKSWFIDFDPVRAKAEGQTPPGMDPGIAALFPSEFQDSEMGEIPKGWSASDLGNVAELNPTRSLSKGEPAPYVGMASLPTAGHRPTDWVDREAGSGARFQNGDTLLARITPCLENGKTGFVDFLPDGQVGWGSTEYIVIRPRPPLAPEWGYLLARDPVFRDFATQKMEGTTGRQRVPAAAIANYPIASPSTEVANAFGKAISPLFQEIKALDEQGRTLAAARDALLPRLLSGEVPVGEAQDFEGTK